MAVQLSFHFVTKAFPDAEGKWSALGAILRRPRRLGHPVVRGFSETIAAGERALLVGPNGSGKTTLLKLGAGIFLPDSGEVLIGDRPAARAERSLLGLMLSTKFLYLGMTGRQNLEYTASLYGIAHKRRRIDEAVARWGLDAFLHKQVQAYSNGMKSLLAMARATLHGPQLLLLDEPAAFLDEAHRSLLERALRAGKETILVTAPAESQCPISADRVLQL